MFVGPRSRLVPPFVPTINSEVSVMTREWSTCTRRWQLLEYHRYDYIYSNSHFVLTSWGTHPHPHLASALSHLVLLKILPHPLPLTPLAAEQYHAANNKSTVDQFIPDQFLHLSLPAVSQTQEHRLLTLLQQLNRIPHQWTTLEVDNQVKRQHLMKKRMKKIRHYQKGQPLLMASVRTCWKDWFRIIPERSQKRRKVEEG